MCVCVYVYVCVCVRVCVCVGIYFDKGGGDTPWGKKFAFDRAEVQEYFFI